MLEFTVEVNRKNGSNNCFGYTPGSIVIGEDTVMTEIKRGAPWSQNNIGYRGCQRASAVAGTADGRATPYLDEINTEAARFLREKRI